MTVDVAFIIQQCVMALGTALMEQMNKTAVSFLICLIMLSLCTRVGITPFIVHVSFHTSRKL